MKIWFFIKSKWECNNIHVLYIVVVNWTEDWLASNTADIYKATLVWDVKGTPRAWYDNDHTLWSRYYCLMWGEDNLQWSPFGEHIQIAMWLTHFPPNITLLLDKYFKFKLHGLCFNNSISLCLQLAGDVDMSSSYTLIYCYWSFSRLQELMLWSWIYHVLMEWEKEAWD